MKYSCKVIIQDYHVNDDGKSACALQAFINGKKVIIGINYYVKESAFDKKLGLMKPNTENASDHNIILKDANSRANKIFYEYRLRNITLTPQAFRNEFLNPINKDDFLAFYERKMKERLRDGRITQLTYNQNKYLLAKLKAFRREIILNDLNTDFLNAFNRYLKKEKNSESTRSKNFCMLKTYIKLALRENSSMQNPFEGFVMPKQKNRIVFLTKDEIKKIYDYYYSSEIMEGHKKPLCAWLWMCFTSLRVSDCFAVSHTDIHDDMLIFVPHKNRKKKPNPISIPINKMARKFIETEKDNLIKSISPQKCNEAYKEIAKLECVSINKNITNHVARHTYATQFIMNGGDVVALNKIMDHSTMEQTMVYVHIADEYKTIQSNKVFDNFFPEENN